MTNQSAKNWRPYRLEIRGQLKTLTAMHVGSGQALHAALDAPLLRDSDGRPYIPGASIRGVWNHWLGDESVLLGCAPEHHEHLFGSAPQGGSGNPDNASRTYLGRVTVEESYLNAEASPAEVRDHVRIDKETGSASDGAKFDSEVLPAGSKFDFRAAYEGDGPEDLELILLGEAIRLLRAGGMHVGGKSAWGWGNVQLQAIEHRCFARDTGEGLASWFQTRMNDGGWSAGEPKFPDAPIFDDDSDAISCLTFDMRLHFEGPVLVRSSILPEGEQAADDVFVYTGPDERKYLPGSSLRGVLRGRAGLIAALGKNETLVDDLFGPEMHEAADQPKRRGLIQVYDGNLAALKEEVLVDHVGIDRILGGAKDGVKFAARPLSSPVFEVKVRLRFRQGQAGALALWARLLRDLMRKPGDMWVGACTSRGYGYLHHAEVTLAELDLVRVFAKKQDVVFESVECNSRPGRFVYTLHNPGFGAFAPLWKLAGNVWKKGAKA